MMAAMTTTETTVTAERQPQPRGRLALLLRGARTRILAAFVILMAFSTLLSVLAIRQLLLARTADRVDAALTQEVEEFRTLVSGNNPADGTPFRGRLRLIFDTFFDRNVPGEGETLIAYVDGRQYAFESAARGGAIQEDDHPARWAELRRSERGDFETPAGATVRYLAVPIEGAEGLQGVFVVASSLSSERREVEEAVRLAALVLLSVLLIASVLAWLVAGRVLAPLRLLADTARSIGESGLSQRIPVTGNDEIADLSRTFNAMLDRLEAAFQTQREFVSDASHELRTPITIVRGHLELLGDDPEERRETIALVTGELDRMSRFVDDLLLLAKAEREDFLRVSEIELGALTDELLDKAKALGDRRWELESRGEAVLVGDRQRLTQALMGLAQNAVQHTEPGDRVWLGTEADRREARLWVRDPGPGVAPDDQERIFSRFARASASRRRSEGAGLGLAIVRAIAEAHGGRVALSSRPGAGATFTVIIPLGGP
jgi:two-component system, OmpR family, sensor kinase